MKNAFLFFFFTALLVSPHLSFAESQTNTEQIIQKNLDLHIHSAEFPEKLDWFNVKSPLRMENLKGKVVLLDFWTYCCINCMHVIPELKKLEEKYPNELVVVGVHSAKFTNERDSENIRQSILRYEIKHPVVNDPELKLWQQYEVHAWPTLVLIDAEGNVVLGLSGEGHYEVLDQAIALLIKQAEAKSILNRTPIELVPETLKDDQSFLKFPGKIFATENEIVISDSNHNRIIVINQSGEILQTIGKGAIGAKDGNFEEAEFHHPQGIFKEGSFIFVADTENHLIREIDLDQKTVKTIAGQKEKLNSPWDLVKVGNVLYIAMAGAHQIWSLDLKSRNLGPIAGSGREDILDGKDLFSALAQPSGIAFDGDQTLYFADSEVSALRSFNLKSREVKTLIGEGLFQFGDRDGNLKEAKLQHPLGVAFENDTIYIADTYNSKVKAIHLKNSKIETIAGSEKGFKDGAPGKLYEPGGISIFAGNLYIADTNNHTVRVLDLKSRALSTLSLLSAAKPVKPKKNPFLETIRYPEETLKKEAIISVLIHLPKDHEFTQEAPFTFEILKEGKRVKQGTLKDPGKELPLNINLGQDEGKITLQVNLEVPYCSKVPPKLCKFKSIQLTQPIWVNPSGKAALKLETQI